MQISSIGNISPNAAIKGTANNNGSFTDILAEAIDGAKQAETNINEQNTALITGEIDDLHTPVIEAQKAEVMLSLAVAVRNKVIEAYNEIMRMQV